MKKAFLILSALLIFSYASFAQAKYYKGEWVQGNSTYLFKSFMQLNFDGSKVKGMIIWTIITPDSNNSFSLSYYAHNRLNRSGIEIVEGSYDPRTRDLSFLGLSKIDPDSVMGVDIYSLKLSADGNVIHGKTDANGKGNGYFYATLVSGAEKEFNTMKEKIK